MRTRLLTLVLLLFAASCAASAGRGGGRLNLLIQEDLETGGTGRGELLYDTVQRLRPRWIQASPTVFIVGANQGNTGLLRSLTTGTVQQVRFYPPEQAVSRFGGQFGNGVIEVTRRQ